MYQRGKNVVSASSVNTTKFDALRVRLIEQVGQALHHGLARLGLLDRARLGGGDAEDIGTSGCHSPFEPADQPDHRP